MQLVDSSAKDESLCQNPYFLIVPMLARMTYSLVIRNCKLLFDGYFIDGDLLIDGEVMAGFSRSGLAKGDEYYDAHGLVAMPGGVDAHVHFRDPSSNHGENFGSGTLAAAHGGVTTVAEMPNTEPPITSVEAFDLKRKSLEGRSYVDYMLHGGTGKSTLKNIEGLAAAGATAVKVWMVGGIDTEAFYAPDTETLKGALLEIRKTKIPLLVHAEDKGAASDNSEGGAIGYATRMGCQVETVAVARVCELARQLGSRAHFVHISCPDSVEIVRLYKQWNAPVTVETTPHYMSLTMDELRKRGAYAKIGPPLRTSNDAQRILSQVVRGEIDFVASDHAPYESKFKDNQPFDSAAPGMPGVETSLPFLLDLCFHRNVLTLDRLIEVISTNPAKFLGVYPKKGSLQPGSDADIVLVDPKKEFVVSETNLLTKTKQSLFLGSTFVGCPVATFMRGKLIMEGMKSYTKPLGKFMKPTDGIKLDSS
jgi:allantoinase